MSKLKGNMLGLSDVHSKVLQGTDDALFLSVQDIELTDNVRTEIVTTSEEFLGLKLSIKEKGIIQPVLVTNVGMKYRLIAGYRRFTAYSELVKSGDINDGKIPASCVGIKDEAEYTTLQLIENIQREDLDIFDKGTAFHTLYEHIAGESEPREILANLLSGYKNNGSTDAQTNFVGTGLGVSVRSLITAYQAVCLPPAVIAILRGHKEFHTSLIGELYAARELNDLEHIVCEYVAHNFDRNLCLKLITKSKSLLKPVKEVEKKQVSYVGKFDKLLKVTNEFISIAESPEIRVKKKAETLAKIAELRSALDKAEEMLR